MTVNIENNPIAKIVADVTVEDKVAAIAALLDGPEGVADVEEYRKYLQARRLQISTDLIAATDTRLIGLSASLMKEAAAPNAAARDFSRVASVSGDILIRLGKHGEVLTDAISRTNDIIVSYGLLHSASENAGHQDIVENLDDTLLEVAREVEVLTNLKNNNDDNIMAVAATLAAKTADRRVAPKAPQQQGLQQ